MPDHSFDGGGGAPAPQNQPQSPAQGPAQPRVLPRPQGPAPAAGPAPRPAQPQPQPSPPGPAQPRVLPRPQGPAPQSPAATPAPGPVQQPPASRLPQGAPRPPMPAPAPGLAPRPPVSAVAPGAPRPAAKASPPAPSSQPAGGNRSGCANALLIALFGLALSLLIVGGVLVAYASIARDLPPPEELQQRASHFASTIIYDRQGGVINEMADPNFGRRTVVPLDRISSNLIAATIATEDPNFYQHAGVDPVGIARAIYHAIREQDLSGPGGSTITQQLVKLTFLSAERSLSRKIKEAILAAEITRRYSKETILQIYLNEINYGNLAYGIEAAAETYFGKSATDLTLAEAALLAGLPQAPSYYDPYTRLWQPDGKPGPVKERQGIVLSLMVRHGAITPAQADAAWLEPIRLKPLQQTIQSKYPHFVQYARSQVEQRLGPELLAKGGLRIYTTLDGRLQEIAQEEAAKQVKALASQNAGNAAVVAIQPKTGEVLAMVGSADFFDAKISGQINMALAPRQPGSSIKPFTYLAAFEMPASVDVNVTAKTGSPISAIEPPGYWTAATALMDVRTEFPDGANPPYVPTNYDEKEHGLVTVRSALANSYNVPAVKALEHAGLDRLKQMAGRVGITTLTRPDYGLSLTLGGGEVTLLEMTAAYAVLANGGTRAAVSPIACVLDPDGKLIWRGVGAEAIGACTAAAARGAAVAVTPAPAQPVLNPQHAFVMTAILGDQEARRPMFGANAALLSLPDRPSAAKTGTSNDYRDAWTVGYTPDLAVGVWVGNADNKPMQKVAGSLGAAPIWQNTMKRGLQGKPSQAFAEPAGIQHVRVCADTGTLPSEACPATREELFAANQGPLPGQFDLYQRVRVDKVTGRLATEFTPADRIETRNAMLFPPKYRAWAEAHGIPQFAADQPAYPFPPELTLYTPLNDSRVTGVIEVGGRIHLPPPLVWRVEYGVGRGPIGWGVISGPAQGDIEGLITGWDTAVPVAKHNVDDFSVRLAAYDPANMDYPVAVSNVAYIRALIPTVTSSPTPTASRTPTVTPTATLTPTLAATATATLAATASPSPVPTLVATPIAPSSPTATSTSTVASPAPTSTSASTSTPTAPPTAGFALRALITEPADRATVSGAVKIAGTAAGATFESYVLEFVPGEQEVAVGWLPVELPRTTPVTAGLLGVWRTETLRAGTYTLRLRVMGAGATQTTAVVRVVVGP